ncbi:MAG TPA: MogA/MoaB family molybdenum cofactor biosynthesis protein [Mycobacteriales bacterium]|jgi:molybdenum cofactor synthesis domain-containing protein|nr:MogA/MoaB family molybdenum cofactor biosynthesis protein [Mycobacteriales bacterium]
MTSPDLPADARARVITVSDRSHGGLRHDESGPLLSTLLGDLGFAAVHVVVVPDDIPEIEAAIREAVTEGVDLVATTGGTGFAPRDVTPEATRRVIDREAPGLAEALRTFNRDKVPTTILSRAVAGVAGATIVVNLPGSPSGVRDGASVLEPVIGHAITQLRGGDH